MVHLLGHELFHAWNGLTITSDDHTPEGADYWFSEGFTNFYARRLLYRAGLVSLDATIAQLDSELAAYDASPLRAAPNQAIVDGFWKSHDLENLPYARGNAIAIAVDREIARVSKGHRSLDDVMRELVVEARAGGHVSVDSLLARFARETSPPFAAKLRAAIVDGAPVPLDPNVLAPCLRVAHEQRPQFQLGFDLKATQAAGFKVVGVVAGSRAATAGLRDGDQLRQVDLEIGKPMRPVELVVDGGRMVRYLPQGALVDVRVFELADATACAKIL